MDFDTFMEHADQFLTDVAFAILLPMTKGKSHSKVHEVDLAWLPEAVRFALADPRSEDITYTAFDTVNRMGSTVKKIVLQMGKGTVQRRFVTGVPQSL